LALPAIALRSVGGPLHPCKFILSTQASRIIWSGNRDARTCYNGFMDEELTKAIKKSTYNVEAGVFRYAKVSSVPSNADIFLITKDKDEITVVARNEQLASLETDEVNKENYSLIALNVSVPFYTVGFLAAVSTALSDRKMNVLIVSTFSKDYILVKQEKLDDVKSVLDSLGFSSKPTSLPPA